MVDTLIRLWRTFNRNRQIRKWRNSGASIPPPHYVKQAVIIAYQNKFRCETFVETGTYYGDMVEVQKKYFKQLYSIELSPELFQKAKFRFKDDSKVKIIEGDSGKVLPSLMNGVKNPAIFWLDGHYSEGITAKGEKNCPIIEEIDGIFSESIQNHVILVDDARCFNGTDGYPTIDELFEHVKSKNSRYNVMVESDVIRFTIDS